MIDACYIYGYGSESLAGDPTLDLRLAQVNIISQESCVAELGKYNAPERNSGMFCAIGAKPGVDACSVCMRKKKMFFLPFFIESIRCFQGDSGSGLICIHNGVLAIVGITTYGLDCGINGMPGVYTSVAHFSSFIRDVVLNGGQ